MALIVLPMHPLFKAEQLLLIPILLAFSLAFSWMAYKSWCSIRITDVVEHWQSKKKRTFLLDKVLYIDIRRSLIMPSSISAYLVVNDSGYERDLLFSQYYLFGERHEAKAGQLATLLNIQIKDPLGARWRQSSWYLVRLLGKGHLWKFWALIFFIALPFAGLIFAIALFRS